MIDEPGSDLAETLANEAHGIVAVVAAYPEARAALSRARRERRLSAPRLGRAKRELDDLWPHVDAVEIDDGLARAAGELAEEFSLRALDAVHLGAALAVAEPDLVLATWDRRLGEAARAAGLNVAP